MQNGMRARKQKPTPTVARQMTEKASHVKNPTRYSNTVWNWKRTIYRAVINPWCARVMVVVVCVCLSVTEHLTSQAMNRPRIQRQIKVENMWGVSLKLLRSGVTT